MAIRKWSILADFCRLSDLIRIPKHFYGYQSLSACLPRCFRMVDILVHGLPARNRRKSRILDDKSTPINQENCLQTSDLSGRSLVKRLKEPPSSAELVLVHVISKWPYSADLPSSRSLIFEQDESEAEQALRFRRAAPPAGE